MTKTTSGPAQRQPESVIAFADLIFSYFKKLSFGILCLSWMLFASCKTGELSLAAVSNTPGSFPDGTADSSSVLSSTRWRSFMNQPDLVQLIEGALQNNQQVLIARQRIEMAAATYLNAKGALLPSLHGAASAGVERFGDYTIDGVGNFDTNFSTNISRDQRIPNPVPDYYIGLRSQWEIDLWGRLRKERSAARARLEATGWEQKLIMTELIAQVAGQYYTLLALDAELEVVNRNITLQQRAVEVVEIQKQGGRATELAVQQSLALLYRTQALAYEIKQEITQTEAALRILTGSYELNIARPDFSAQTVPALVSTGIPAQMLSRRPDMLMAEKHLEAANADVFAARAAFFPTLSINAQAGFNAFSSALIFDPGSLAYGLAGGLLAPIFQRNALKANMKFATARQMESLLIYQQSALKAYQEVFVLLRQISNLENSYQFRRREVEELLKATASAANLYASGYASYLEVLTAQKSVLEAEIEVIELRRRQFEAIIGLYRALGGGVE